MQQSPTQAALHHVDADSTSEPDAKRRKLRKGTRSCWGKCKRRKVRCEFTLPTDEICIACRRRGGHCVSQEFPEEASHSENIVPENQGPLADRLLRVESLLSQLVQQVANGSAGGGTADPGILTPSPTVLSDSLPPFQDTSELRGPETPFCIIRAQQTDQGIDTAANRNRTLSHALCAAFPSLQDINTLCSMNYDSTIYLYQIWFRPNIDFSMGGKDVIASISGPPSPETHPVLLAKRMLVTAIFFQYFPPRPDHGFTEDPRQMTLRIADEAIRLVSTNEHLHGWIESIEVIMLEALYHSNFGNLRRAWLAIRRAIMVGQLMGIDRPGPSRFRLLDASQTPDTHFMWHNLVYSDRYFSLMLGLPCAVVEDLDDYEKTIQSGVTGTSWLSLELQHSRVVRRLLSRCRSADSDKDTQELDDLLIKAAKSVPDDFWMAPNFHGPDNTQATFWKFIRAMNQVKHYSLLNALHLPYLLREDPDRKYEHSKVSCLMASREILRRYNSFRANKPVLSCCRPLDFVALLASLTVMVAQMNTRRPNITYSFLAHQRPSDRSLIEQVLVTMDRVAQVNDDAMTYQSASLLRKLLHIEADAYAGHCYLTEEVGNSNNVATKDNCTMDECTTLHLEIPYFGVIRISRQANEDMERPQMGSAGAGANSRTLSGVCPQHGTSQPTVAPYLASTGAIDFSLYPSNEASLDITQSFQYPDLTATVDDWAFQGVDHTFFGSIMNNATFGLEDMLPSSWPAQTMLAKAGEEFFKPSRAFTG